MITIPMIIIISSIPLLSLIWFLMINGSIKSRRRALPQLWTALSERSCVSKN